MGEALSEAVNIAFVGAGNMATSIIGGLIANGYSADQITASAPSKQNLDQLSQQFAINTSQNNLAFIEQSQVIVLAVKPQIMQTVCEELAANLTTLSDKLILSIAAGVPCAHLQRWLSPGETEQNYAVVRCMPNTPAKVLAGASGLFANDSVSSQQRQQAEDILSAVGNISWVEDESLMDSVTAIAGSGPAYFFLFIEAMIDAGVAQGLARNTAEDLAIQTAYGAAKLAKESQANGIDVKELRRRVTSPKGTTEQAIVSFENNHLRDIVSQAMDACRDRAEELADAMSNTHE